MNRLLETQELLSIDIVSALFRGDIVSLVFLFELYDYVSAAIARTGETN